MPFSLRLDPETEGRLRRAAAATGRSQSEVVRDAVERYVVAHEERAATGMSAFDRVKAFAGIVRVEGAHYSVDTHEKYRALLRHKHRARRSR